MIVTLNNREETSGKFTNLFRESIELPAYSKICLQSAVMKLRTKKFVIDATNDRFRFGVSVGINDREAVIDHGEYSAKEFADALQRALNSGLKMETRRGGPQDADKMTGFQWRVFWGNTDQKIHLVFNRTDTDGYGLDFLSDQRNITHNAGVWTKHTQGVDGDFDGWVISERYFNNGCGWMQVRATSNALDYGLLIGLKSIKQDDNNFTHDDDQDVSRISWGIYSAPSQDGTTLEWYVKYFNDEMGVPVIESSEIAVNVDDMVYIQLSEGRLRYLHRRTGSNVFSEMFSQEWGVEDYDDHHLAVCSLSKEDATCRDLEAHFDPYHHIGKLYETYNDANGWEAWNDEAQSHLLRALVGTRVSLHFTGYEKIMNLIGFNVPEWVVDGHVDGEFIADRSLSNIVIPDNLKIEIPNMSLENYDSFTGGARRILSTIPNLSSLEQSNGKYLYQSQYPVWTELRNSRPVLLNSVVVELLDFKNNLVEVEPDECFLSVLINSDVKYGHSNEDGDRRRDTTC